MKTKEQIELAQEMVASLQDYVELSKALKKLKRVENKEVLENQVATITEVVKAQAKNI